MRTLMILLLAATCLTLAGCGEETKDGGTTPTCDAGDQKCEGFQIVVCQANGTWGAAQACPTGQTCGNDPDQMPECLDDGSAEGEGEGPAEGEGEGGDDDDDDE